MSSEYHVGSEEGARKPLQLFGALPFLLGTHHWPEISEKMAWEGGVQIEH